MRPIKYIPIRLGVSTRISFYEPLNAASPVLPIKFSVTLTSSWWPKISDTVKWDPQTAVPLATAAARFGFTGIIFNLDCTPPLQTKKGSSELITNPIRPITVPLVDAHKRLSLSTVEFAECGLLSSERPLDPNSMIQMSRITVKISDPNQMGFLNTVCRSHQFDLVAVSPEDEGSWNVLLNQGEYDIIKLDLTSQRVPFALKRHQLLQLSRRGIFFEICLSDAIQDPMSRRHLFTNVQKLVRFLPHNKLFITSGASHPLGLRSPQDVANVAQLMGIKDKPQAVMSDNAMGSIYRSAARRTAGGMVGVKRTVNTKEG